MIARDGRHCDRDGRRFVETWTHDSDYGPPHVENDGHGVVEELEWLSLPELIEEAELRASDGEDAWFVRVIELRSMRELALSRTNNRCDTYYNWIASYHKAEQEGWGMGPDWKAANPNATREDELRAAVDADYDYLRGWYNGDWCYMLLTVTELGENGDVADISLGGIESLQSDEELQEYVDDLIAELL